MTKIQPMLIKTTGLAFIGGIMIFSFQNATTSNNANPTIPPSMISSDGKLANEARDMELSCPTILKNYGIPLVTLDNFVDESKLMPSISMSCAEFRDKILTDVVRDKKTGFLKERHGVITQSIRLTSACSFPKTHIEIAASNISLDCAGSTFDGGEPSAMILKYGISLVQNETASKVSAASLPVIRNLKISNCNFENYKTSGVFLANRFNRQNPLDQAFYNDILLPMHRDNQFDLIGQASPADRLRALSPSHISLNNVSVRNTPNGGFYIQNSLTKIDLSRVKAMYNRTGLYLDFGTREIQVRNACFLKSGQPDPRRTKQDIADEERLGREGIAVDASAGNRVVNSLFYYPRTGAVHFYKNCWERYDNYKTSNGLGQFPRRQPSDGNLIQNNVIVGGLIGISLAHRQWSNISYSSTDPLADPGHCGDRFVNTYKKDNVNHYTTTKDGKPYSYSVKATTTYRTYADYARSNRILKNTFFNSDLPIRSQDDANLIQGNIFRGKNIPYLAVIGKKQDPKFRGRSVINNEFKNNISFIRGVKDASALISFPGESRSRSIVNSNTHNGKDFVVRNTSSVESWCALPIEVPSSSPADEEACVFGLNMPPQQEGQILKLIDGGRVHGQLQVTCRDGSWVASAGYCCSQPGCEKTASKITGELD